MNKSKGYTYKEAHNKAVRSYQKNVSVLFWLGLLNLTGITIGLISSNTHYFPALLINVTIFHELNSIIADTALLILIKVLIGMITSSALIFAWLYAKKGNKYALFGVVGFYAIEVLVMFIFDPFSIPQILLHLIIIGFLVFALGAYYQIFAVEKHYNKKD